MHERLTALCLKRLLVMYREGIGVPQDYTAVAKTNGGPKPSVAAPYALYAGRLPKVAAPLSKSQGLLESSIDFAELGVQVAADARQDGDDHDCDERSNQAVFNSRGARLVLHVTRKKILHGFAPVSTLTVRSAPSAYCQIGTVAVSSSNVLRQS